jgi:hypothetical protein
MLEKFAKRVAEKKIGEFAPGISSRKPKAAIPRVARFGKPVTWWYTDHKHDAVRAGLHTDLRLSDGYKAYSWAVRKGMPKMPGEKVLAIRQPDHKPSYTSFEGHLSSGYGKTKGRGVWVAEQGPARIIVAGPQKIRFTLIKSQNPRHYTMIHQGGDKWLLINTTPTTKTRPGVPQSKPKYKEESPETFKPSTAGLRKALMAKIDGAHVSVNFDRESPEVYSHRPSERKSGLIDHTYLAGLERVRTPKALRGARVRGEIFAVDKSGRTIPNRELAGILNSSPMRGRNTLDSKNLSLRLGVFDAITAPGGGDVTATPWGEKHKILKRVSKAMGRHGFLVPDTAIKTTAQKKLFDKIREGRHPQSSEGTVEWDLDQPGPPTKRKFRGHHQVYIHAIHRGEGKTNANTMGRYSYSLTPNGPPVGFVGTGFSRVRADWMWKNRSKLKGRKVIIKSLEQFPSGAFRAPSHSHLHL